MSRDDADLTDEALRDEIELVASLVVAASGCAGRMDRAELDALLGVQVCPSRLQPTTVGNGSKPLNPTVE